MVDEDLKALQPISKSQARNEIQNALFKYHMAAMQLQNPITEQFWNNFRANFLPNSSTNSSGGSSHWIHGMNMNNSLQRKLNSTAKVDDNFSPSKGIIQSSNNFGNNFQTNFSPNSSTNSSGGSHRWIHGMNKNNYNFS